MTGSTEVFFEYALRWQEKINQLKEFSVLVCLELWEFKNEFLTSVMPCVKRKKPIYHPWKFSQVKILTYKIPVHMGNVDFIYSVLEIANFSIFLGAMKNVGTGRCCTVSRKVKTALSSGTARTGVSTFSFMYHSESLIRTLTFQSLD